MAEHVDTADRKVDDTRGSEIAADCEVRGHMEFDSETGPSGSHTPRQRARRRVIGMALGITVALGVLAAWQGIGLHRSHQTDIQRGQYIQAGRQEALNLTTIDWEHAERDVQRILDSATGGFREDFANRSPAFIEVVKKARSRSEGTITESALESESGDTAQVLVAVSVAVANAGAPEQEPRRWRMRMSVQKIDDEMKISQVDFVP